MRKCSGWKLASAMSFSLLTLAGSAASAANLINHGGPVITSAHVVFLFWGPTFQDTTSSDHTYATHLQNYRDQLGTNGTYNILTQYCGSNGCIQLSNLAGGTADWFDSSTPPTNVTDSLAQSEVNAYLASHASDANAIYEVVLPSSSYSSSGGSTSCGGPSLAYCAYRSWIGSGASAIQYAVEPFPSCSGCRISGWTAAQSQERFLEHELADAVTDPLETTWYDKNGLEVAQKCSDSFLSGNFGYQSLWSNAAKACVQTQ